MARELRIRIETEGDAQAKKNLAGVEDGLDRVTGAAGKTNKEITEQEKNWRRLGAAIGAAFSIQQLSQQAGKVTELTSRTLELSEKLGITTDAVQELGFAARQQGATIEQVGSALAIMGRNITEGGKGVEDALGRIGLTVDALRGLKPDEVFTQIATAISKIPDPMQRSQVAMAVFGRSGAELLPLLTSNVADLRERARELGIVMGEDLIRQGEKLGDTWDAQQQRVDALRTKALLPLFDLFQSLPAPIQTVLALGYEFSGVLTGIATAALLLVGPKAALAGVGSALTSLGSTIGTVVAAIGAIPLAFVAAGAALIYWRDDIMEDLAGLKYLPQFFADLWSKITGGIKSFAANTLAAFVSMHLSVVDTAKKLYEGVKTWLVDKFVGIVDGIKGKIDAVTGFFKDMYTKVVGGSYVPDMVTEIGQWMQQLGPLMVQPAEAATQRTTSAFQTMLATISNQFTSWGNSLSEWFSGHLPGIFGKGLGSVASGLLSSFSSLITGGISSLVQMGANLAWQGLKWLGNKIKGLFGNATAGSREDFASSLGFANLGGLYDKLRTLGPEGNQLAHIGLNVIGRNDTAANQRWMQDVSALLNGRAGSMFSDAFGGMSSGAGGLTGMPVSELAPAMGATITVHFAPHIVAWDGQSVRDWALNGGKDVIRQLFTEVMTEQARYLQEA